jgi:hypothetical protein
VTLTELHHLFPRGCQVQLTAAGKSQDLAPKVKTKQKGRSKGQKSKLANLHPLIPDPHAEAEACFVKAIEIARRQEAKSLELRAVMSLVRLRQQQTTPHASPTMLKEARSMLSAIYGWFTEGLTQPTCKRRRPC